MKKSNRVVSFLLALTLVTGLMPADAFTFTAYATAQDGKPADGTLVNGEVFPTGVSQNFRIPGLVNFQGNLIASADARWDYEYDGGGMDLVVSRSSDGGATWNYTFAGYLGDNGNEWNKNSTTLMDPVIITDGETLYLVADMFPAGYSISSSSTANVFSDTNIGFDAEGRLLLSDDGRSSYGYYLSGNKIYQTDGTVVSGYTVDGWFNLYNADEYVTNLFFADSPYQVRATSYICMMSSSDGKNWSEPTLLNVKPQGVSWMVLGPGSGIVTQDGYIAFTAYDGSNIHLIYGKDGTWNRVSTSAATNESSIIELNDGTIRAFVKRGGNNTIAYVDFTKNNDGSYSATGLTDTGEANFSQCMVSSLHYSRTLEGKEVVLVCCPAKPNSGAWDGRFNGKIFVFTLDENNAMTLVDSHALNGETEFFAYSNMAEMDDGTIAVLYEDDCISYSAGNYTGTRSHITFTTVDLEEALGKTFDAVTLTDDNTDISVTAPDLSRMEIIKLAESQPVPGFSRSATYSIKLYNSKGQLYSGRAKVQIPVTDGLGDCERYIGSVDGELFEVEAPVDGFFTVTVPHFSDVTISGYKAGDPATVNVKLYKGLSKTVLLDGWNFTDANITAAPNGGIATMLVNGNAGATETTVSSETTTALEDGASYIIRVYDTVYALTSNKGRGDWGTNTLAFEQNNLTVEEDCVWTLEASGSGYKLKCEAGYLNLGTGNNSGYIDDTGEIFTLTYTATGWTVGNQSGRYINALGGLDTYYSAGGWTGDGTRFDLYKVTTKTSASTEVTFTGTEVGTTTAKVGHVIFNIEVLDPASATAGDIAGFTAIVGTENYTGDTTGGVETEVVLKDQVITALTIDADADSYFPLGVNLADAEMVQWSVAHPDIATVDLNGKVSGIKEGNTTVTATVYKDGVCESVTIPVHVIASLGTETEMTTVCYYVKDVVNSTAWYTLYCDHELTGTTTEIADELVEVVEGQVIYFRRPVNSRFAMIWMAAPKDGYVMTYMAATGSISQYYPLHSGNSTLATSSGYFASTETPAYYNLYDSYGATKSTIDTMFNSALAKGADSAMAMGRRSQADGEGSPRLGSSLSFAAEKEATVSQELSGVLPKDGKLADFRRYTGARMTAVVGDYVYFAITVTQEAPEFFDPAQTTGKYSLLTYSNTTLTDELTGAYFYDQATDKADDIDGDGVYWEGILKDTDRFKTKDITNDLNAAWSDEDIAKGYRELEYFVIYTIQEGDSVKYTDDTIANIATYAYTFTSKYSNVSASSNSEAPAYILVVDEYMGEYVVDFSLPLVIADDGSFGLSQVTEDGKDSVYGEVDISDNTLTYTLTSTLLTADEVLLYRVDGSGKTLINSFTVVPATTVYYEDTFITPGTGWSSQGTILGLSQNMDQLGDLTGTAPNKAYPYGYDPAYNAVGPSDNTYLQSLTIPENVGVDDQYDWPVASFTFTGTGIEIYANCSASTGAVMVEIWKADGSEMVRSYMVDTKTDKDYYGLPIVSVTDLPHGAYNVKLIKVKDPDLAHERYPETTVARQQGAVNIDGFRVYGTLVEDKVQTSSMYYPDLEDHPVYYELRDQVLTVLNLPDEDMDWATVQNRLHEAIDNWEQLQDFIGNQVYDESSNLTAALISGVPVDAIDLLKNGPKNELFLMQGQSLVFTVTTNRLMQIGLKVPQGQTNVEVSVTYDDGTPVSHKVPTSITSSVDMFYELGNENGTERTYTITITNNGTNVLSVTKLKICDDPDASFGTLTEEDVVNVLIDQGLMPQRTDKDATVRVSLQDYAGNQVGAVTLSKRGADGRRVTFTAAEILAAAEKQMPEGYDFVNKEAVFDVTATYGESREAYVQVGKVATVNITYISLSKRKVYTVTVTKIQFAEGDCQLSVTELMHYSPLGRFLLMMSGITAEYGAETDVVVTVL